jgi:hypothetical protein
MMGNNISKLRNHTPSNMAYCEATPEKGGQKAQSAIHGPLGRTIFPYYKSNLETLFRVRDLCDSDQVEAKVEALLATIHKDHLRFSSNAVRFRVK